MSTGALSGRPGSSLLTGDPEGYVKDVLETCIFLYGAPSFAA